MKISLRYRVVLILCGLLMLCTSVFAADQLYRFMHNDHDVLIIGEITKIDETGVKIRAVKGITSAKGLNKNCPKKQLKLSEAKIILPFGYMGFHNENGEPHVGDYVLVSLEKVGNDFKVAWGAYKVNSLDYKNLSVVLPENAEVWSKMEAAAVETFINSDGQITEFAFDGDSKTVYARKGEEEFVIYEEDIDDDKNTSSIGIIGGADGPTSIFISENPIKAMMLPVIHSLFWFYY